MKAKYTVADIMCAMIDGSDHSDITDDFKCFYHIFVRDDGSLAGDGEEFSVTAEIDPDIYSFMSDEIRDYHKNYDMSCAHGVPRPEGYDDAIGAFLDRFDSEFETAENPYFVAAAEDLYAQSATFLAEL